jgi:membrane-bound lytic murein transglycosylase D
VTDLARYNALSPDAHLRGDMTLQALVANDAKLDHVRHTEDGHARVLLAGSEAFHEHFEAQKGKKRVEIRVKKGDTLASLGRRYGMSVGSMERVNQRSRRSELLPGEHLIVYTDRKVADQREELSRSPLPALVAPLPEALPGRAP